MDTNTSKIQANTFAKGMDTDTSDMLIDSEAYRLAKNLRYITDVDETTGELRLIEGAAVIKSMEDATEDAGRRELVEGWKILGYSNVGNVGALVIEKGDDPVQWAVFRLNYTPGSQNDIEAKRVFGWCEDPLSTNKISTVLKWENDNNILLYIADGTHKIIKIDLYDKSNPPKTAIQYTINSSELLTSAPVLKSALSGGKLTAGLVQYAYRLYNDNNTTTKLSPLSNLFYIRDTFKVKGPIGLSSNATSLMGMRIGMTVDQGTLGDPDSLIKLFPKILVFRIHYIENGQQPTISLIYDNEYQIDQNSLIIVEDYGTENLQYFTTEEFNSLSGIDLMPLVIEQKDHYLFAGNIRYPVVSLDPDYLNMDFRAFSTGDGIGTNINWSTFSGQLPDNAINSNLDLSLEYDEESWYDVSYDSQETIGGSGKNIQWRLNADPSDEQSTREERMINACPWLGGSGQVNSRFTDSEEEPEVLQIENTREDVTVRKGLRHDEVYRYGIILYSVDGILYPVKWIADIRTPKLNYTRDAKDITKLSYVVNNYELMNVLHPVFTVTHVFDTTKIAGYEIVRAVKTVNDTATVALGIVSSTAKSSSQDVVDICSSGLPFLDHMRYNASAGAVTSIAETFINVLLFYSPEGSYFIDNLDNITKSGEKYYLLALCPLEASVGEGTPVHEPVYPSGAYSVYKYMLSNCYCHDFGGYTPRMKYDLTTESGALITWRKFKECVSEDPMCVFMNTRDYQRHGSVTDCIDKVYDVYKLFPATMPDIIDNSVYDDQAPFDPDDVENPVIPKTEFLIEDIGRVYPTDWDKVIVDDKFNGFSQQTPIGSYEFYSISAPYIICYNGTDFTTSKLKNEGGYNKFGGGFIGTCCPSLVFSMDSSVTGPDSIIQYYHQPVDRYARVSYGDLYFDQYHSRTKTELSGSSASRIVDYTDEWSMLCNLRRIVQPYGGYTKLSRDTSTYSHDGYYYKSDYHNAIHMFNGDVVVRLFEFATSHKWFTALYDSVPRCAVICQVAVETSINTDLDYGLRFSNITNTSNMTMLLVNPANVNLKYLQDKYSYSYNAAYSATAQALVTANSTDDFKVENNYFPQRVHYSNQAEMNQAQDPWLVFQPMNYLDVDGSYGGISNLRRFKNSLLFWQERATGVLSVNERIQIVDKSNLSLILGTGGVLERADYITNTNGMKLNQHADTQSDKTLYWWDMDNAMICSYSGGLTSTQLSREKLVLNLLNKGKKESKFLDGHNKYYPHVEYDNKYNEVLFQLGSLGNPTTTDTLVFNELQLRFTSIYDINFKAYFRFSNSIVAINSDPDDMGFCLWNGRAVSNESFDFDGNPLLPYLKYVINEDRTKVKVYDNVEFAGTIPNSDNAPGVTDTSASTLTSDIRFDFNTPLKQSSYIDGTNITNRQLDFKFAIPRKDQSIWGDRLRGKTMQCELSSTSNSLNFSLQYIITKYRISWS